MLIFLIIVFCISITFQINFTLRENEKGQRITQGLSFIIGSGILMFYVVFPYINKLKE